MTPIPSPAFREIAHNSEAYRQECALRQAVLRRPLGLNLYDEDLEAEARQLHFGLFDGNTLLACIVAEPVSPQAVKLRQMAVAPERQGQGHGRTLMQGLENELFRRGYTLASLHARATAVGFYERLGYHPTGSEFIEVTIPHFRMEKRLDGGAAAPPRTPGG